MKIIAKDNFDSGTKSDKLVAENVSSFYAEFLVAKLNLQFSGENAPYFYEAVTDDYKLFVYDPT